MSSEFSCDYCSAGPRNPCYSREEASQCGNCTSRGIYLDYTKEDVITWLRAQWGASDPALESAIDLLERKL